MTTLSQRPTRTSGTSPIHTTGRRGLTVAVAVLAALTVWAIATGGLGLDLVVEPGTSSAQTVGAMAVIVTSLAAGLAGWGVLALLERYAAARALRVWQVGAVLAFLVSLFPILAPGTTDGATRTCLFLLHGVVTAAVVTGLTRSSRTC
jgi:hypothetical protein